MNVSPADIEAAIRSSVGNPETGPIADNAGTMAAAVHQLLQPETKKEKRIIHAPETPAAEHVD